MGIIETLAAITKAPASAKIWGPSSFLHSPTQTAQIEVQNLGRSSYRMANMPTHFMATTNNEVTLQKWLDAGISPAKIILFADHPEYPGYLQVEPFDPDARGAFYAEYRDWMSRHLILNGLHLLEQFTDKLTADGYMWLFTASTANMVEDHRRWSQPLNIDGYTLRPFQQFCMNQALERARYGQDNSERFYFWNWSAGAGKSFCSGAGAKYLLQHDLIDVVLAFTLNDLLKANMWRDWTNTAGLYMYVNDHPKPQVRRQDYQLPGDGFIMNYEKLWVDFDALSELTKDKRVLFVLDEGHKVIAESGQNKARKALDKLTRGCNAIVWPMSATVVGGSPLRFRDVFSLDSYPRKNPLGTKEDFVDRYADKVTHIPLMTKHGGRFNLTRYDWNLPRLHEVRHRVGDRTMAVRKTDPGIREQFKGIECIPEWVPMTNALAEINEAILDDARKARDNGESRSQHYLAMRIAAINPAALYGSDNEVAQMLVAEHARLLVTAASNKLQMLNDRLEGLQQAQEKAVVFCHWTHQGILPLRDQITVPHVVHYGELPVKQKVTAQDKFKTDPDVTCFLTSDAGTHGLNFQEARYVISLDPVYSYDDLTQRNSRIDRADSHLDGLTAYVMITEDSVVETRIWSVCEQRRQLAEAVQGTREDLTYGAQAALPETGNIDWLIGLDD